MSLIGALKAAKKTAPFYSAVDEALGNLKRPKGTGIEFLTEVLKQPGVKKAEIADRKLEQAFKAKGKITKEEAQNILARNPPPKLQERVLEDLSDTQRQEIIDDNMMRYGYDLYDDVPRERMRQWENEIEGDAVKYGDYQTPGGENYREILLKLPQESEKIAKADKKLKLFETAYERDPTQQNYAQMKMAELELDVAKKTSTNYKSQHWDDPNVLAHIRVQDRKGANGEKILHVEEIQSDWHQEGRKKGYAKPETKRLKGTVEEQTSEFGFAPEYKVTWEDGTFSGGYGSREQAQARAVKGKSDAVEGIPDAPFKKNWHELAMKRLLNYAADNGYDSIAITPGAEQAKRYDLSKQVGQISYTPSTKNLMAFDHEGNAVVNKSNVNPEDLEKYLGAGVTQKLSQAEFEGPTQILRGTDISVGGEGMKGFYDQILPSYLNTFGKQYGAQVGEFKMPSPPKDSSAVAGYPLGEEYMQGRATWSEFLKANPKAVDEFSMSLHNFPITPEMRESIKQKGLPLYQQVGIPTAGAGAASQMLEPEEEAGLAGGGSVAKLAALAKLKKMREEMAPRAAVVKDLMAKDSGSYLRDVTPDVLTKDYIEQEIQRMAARAEASKPEVKEAKGGEVMMTKNRDAMFMELSNKKLKRK